MSKTLALTAVTGLVAGLAVACGGGTPAPDAPAADPAAMPAGGAKECCAGKNECGGKGNCKVEGSQDCAGKNTCKGKGGPKSGPGCAKEGDAPAAPAAPDAPKP